MPEVSCDQLPTSARPLTKKPVQATFPDKPPKVVSKPPTSLPVLKRKQKNAVTATAREDLNQVRSDTITTPVPDSGDTEMKTAVVSGPSTRWIQLSDQVVSF